MFVNGRGFPFVFLTLPIIIFIFPIPLSANLVSDIIITEIMYDLPSPGADDKHEWIELYNASNREIDLTDWKINDGDTSTKHNLNTPPENNGRGFIEIAAGEYIILASDAATFLTDHSNSSYSVIDTVLNLNNTSATLTLFDKDNNEIASLIYSKEWGANGNGKSLEKIKLDPNNDQSDWKESSIENGTPGQQNSVYNSLQEQTSSSEDSSITTSPLGDSGKKPSNHPPKAEAGADIIALVNQEITFDASKSSDQDNNQLTFFWNFGDGQTSSQAKPTHQYQFPGKYIINLVVNDGKISASDSLIATIFSNTIIISEFMPNPEGKDTENEWIELYNNSAQAADLSSWQLDTGEKSKTFVFPTNTSVAANQYLILTRSTTKLSLNNTSSKIRLLYPTGQISQEIKYDKAPQEQSVSLLSGNEYAWSAIPTPGLSNIISNSANKTASSLNSLAVEATEYYNSISAIIPVNPTLTPSQSQSFLNPVNNISDSPTAANIATVDNLGKNQISPIVSVSSENKEKPQTQTASLINKFPSPALLAAIIIVLGFAAGLSLVIIRKKIKKY